MEKAIIVNNLKNIKISKLIKFDRIYYGNDFCPKLLPKVDEIRKSLKIFKKMNKPISLLISYIGNDDLANCKAIIDYIAKQKIFDEIIVNDLGIFNFCINKYPNLKLVFGRFLMHYSILRHSNFFKVGRYEYDRNVFDNLSGLQQKRSSYKISLYYPYSVIQGTRYCPLVDSCNGKINPGIVKCRKECLEIGSLILSHTAFKKPLILVSNVQLIKSVSRKEIKKIRNVDRIVYQYCDNVNKKL